jgi:hypothetical protein
MNSLLTAFREYYHALTIIGTKPVIYYTEAKGFQVSWYYKKATIVDRIKGEIIY